MIDFFSYFWLLEAKISQASQIAFGIAVLALVSLLGLWGWASFMYMLTVARFPGLPATSRPAAKEQLAFLAPIVRNKVLWSAICVSGGTAIFSLIKAGH
jgi:hypothetical protein